MIPGTRRVVWLSGRSSARHACLSPGQRRLLAVAEAHGFGAVDSGYPFLAEPGSWTRTGLVGASLRNARQYAALRWGDDGRASVAEALRPLAAGVSELLVVCGSLGLELLVAALPGLALLPAVRLRVVALGPVCAAPVDALDLRVAQGTRDVVSRLGYRGPVHLRPGCGHLGYLDLPEVARLVDDAAGSPW